MLKISQIFFILSIILAFGEKSKAADVTQNKIDIEIRANVGKEMEKDMKQIGEIMKKILEIDVNVKIVSMKNGKNDGILINLKLHNRQTKSVGKRY